MFQLKNRVTSITLNDQEREVINDRIVAYQEKTGVVYSSIKELFSALLSDAMTNENKSTSTETIPAIPEGMLTSEEFDLKLSEITTPLNEQIQTLSTEIVTLTETNKELTLEIEQIQNNQEIEVIETTIEKELQPKETDIYIPLPEQKALILQTIATNRHSKGYDKEKLSVSQVAEKLIFNKGTLYNWSGEIFTGL